MNKERKNLLSYGSLVKATGTAAVLAAGLVGANAQNPPPAAPVKQVMLHAPAEALKGLTARQSDMAKLTNVLFQSPAERKAFVAKPAEYAKALGLKTISKADLNRLTAAIADGHCCGGCGCSCGAPGDSVVLPVEQMRR
jgi:hypothetical protein